MTRSETYDRDAQRPLHPDPAASAKLMAAGCTFGEWQKTGQGRMRSIYTKDGRRHAIEYDLASAPLELRGPYQEPVTEPYKNPGRGLTLWGKLVLALCALLAASLLIWGWA